MPGTFKATPALHASRLAASLCALASLTFPFLPAAADTPPASFIPAPIAAVTSAATNAMPRWELVLAEPTSSLEPYGYTAYRIVLRQGRKELINPPQAYVPEMIARWPYLTKYSHAELLLVPLDESPPPGLKLCVPWSNLEQEYYTTPVHLGDGLGFAWFANASLFFQHYLRTNLALSGGDDPIRLAVDGLLIQDPGNATANSCATIVPHFGDAAIPYLEPAIAQHQDLDPSPFISVLGRIHTDNSTSLLRALYASDNESLSRAAASALTRRPYREAAKPEYLDMLQRRICVVPCARACAEMGWQDALPLLDLICAQPSRWYEYREVYELKRALEGNPVPPQLKEAHQLLSKALYADLPDEAAIRTHLATILATDDEYQRVIGFSMAIAVPKLPSEVVARTNQTGRTILRSLPSEPTEAWLVSLIRGLQDDDDRRAVLDVLLGLWDLADALTPPPPAPPAPKPLAPRGASALSLPAPPSDL